MDYISLDSIYLSKYLSLMDIRPRFLICWNCPIFWAELISLLRNFIKYQLITKYTRSIDQNFDIILFGISYKPHSCFADIWYDVVILTELLLKHSGQRHWPHIFVNKTSKGITATTRTFLNWKDLRKTR